jgi:hypothetical protein
MSDTPRLIRRRIPLIRGKLPLVIVAASLAAAIAACGSSAGPPPESPAQLLASSRQTLQALKSFHVTGTFAVDQVSVLMTATVIQNGDASGTLTVGNEIAKFLMVSRVTYFDTFNSFVRAPLDPSLADVAARLIGQHWWRTSGSPPVAASLQVLNSGVLSTAFFSGRNQLTQTAVKDSRGRPASKLTDSAGSVFITTALPHQVLEITTAPNYLAANLSNVDLVFDAFNAPASVAAPASFVTPVRDGMPPFFHIQSFALDGDCNRAGCPLKAVVQADAGSGAASVSLTVADSNGKTLATCTTSVTLASYSDAQTAKCFATGQSWTNWWNNVGGSFTYAASVANPAYNA